MYNLVHVVFGTAIPTYISLHFLKMFLYLFVHFFGILTKDAVLANIFQVLANNQQTPQFSATYQGQGAEPLQKSQTWTNFLTNT